MYPSSNLSCPVCNGKKFAIKYEASYTYSYLIDSDAPGLKNTEEFLPFLFDKREQKDNRQYVECNTCGTKYPCYFNEWNAGIDSRTLQKVISQDNIANPQHTI